MLYIVGDQKFGNFSKPASTVCSVARASTYVPTYSHGTPKGLSSEPIVQFITV